MAERAAVEEAIHRAVEEFPFDKYMTPYGQPSGSYTNIAGTVARYLEPGSTILDFGCGPCDKTAILQFQVLGLR